MKYLLNNYQEHTESKVNKISCSIITTALTR